MQTVYIAGGCLWGVQAFIKTLPGVVETEAGRANGTTDTLDGAYDGYAECVKTTFYPSVVTMEGLMDYLFESSTRIASIAKARMSAKSIGPASIVPTHAIWKSRVRLSTVAATRTESRSR